MPILTSIHGREIIDSRGNPTIEVECVLNNKTPARAQVPSGASTGSHEAYELRDENEKRFNKKGVLQAVDNVNTTIRKALVGNEYDQKTIDQALCELDGTENKKRLGSNALLGVSMAYARASALEQGVPLYQYLRECAITANVLSIPTPMMNIINGGRHAMRSIDIQECMIVPWGAPSFKEGLRWGVEVFHALKKILEKNGLSTLVGDEGGFSPALSSNEQALDLIIEAITLAGYKPETDIAIALDVAANELYSDGLYHFVKDGKSVAVNELIEWYKKLVATYPICSIEDPLAEDEWDGFALFTESLGSKIQVVGDDLFVTNKKRLTHGVAYKAANAILVKPNQIGTVTETLEVIIEAQRVEYGVIVSHRSGETEDTFIADLAVGLGAGQIKTGSLSRGERVSKYNQLLRIEEEIGAVAPYAGEYVKKQIQRR